MENKLTGSEHDHDASVQIIKKRKTGRVVSNRTVRRIIIPETVRQFLLRNRQGFKIRYACFGRESRRSLTWRIIPSVFTATAVSASVTSHADTA